MYKDRKTVQHSCSRDAQEDKRNNRKYNVFFTGQQQQLK